MGLRLIKEGRDVPVDSYDIYDTLTKEFDYDKKYSGTVEDKCIKLPTPNGSVVYTMCLLSKSYSSRPVKIWMTGHIGDFNLYVEGDGNSFKAHYTFKG